MKTTADFRKFNHVGNFRVFISNISAYDVRVTLIRTDENRDKPARNMNDGEILFQKTYNNWSRVPEEDYDLVSEIVYGVTPTDA